MKLESPHCPKCGQVANGTLLDKGLGTPVMLPAHERASVDFLIDSDVEGDTAALEWLRRHLKEPSGEACRS